MRAYVAAVLVCLSAVAHAESVSVLGLEADGAPDADAVRLTDALRQRLAGAEGWKVLPGKDYVELKNLLGCADDAAGPCLAQAGKMLGTDKIIYGTVKGGPRRGSRYSVTLRLLDVKSGVIERYIPNEPVTPDEVQPGRVNAVAARLLSALVGLPAQSSLTVTSDPQGARVTIDDTVRGTTPLTLTDLAPGLHVVSLAKDDYHPHSEPVTIRPGEASKVDVNLDHVAPGPPVAPIPGVENPPLVVTPQPSHPTDSGRALKVAGIVGLGVAAIAGGIAIYTWRHYTSLEGDAHSALTDLASSNGDYARANAGFFSHPASCDLPTGGATASTAMSSAAAQRYRDACHSGNSFAAATTGLWVGAGVLAAAGVTALVLGYRSHPTEAAPTARFAPRLRSLSPSAGPTGAGVSATFEF